MKYLEEIDNSALDFGDLYDELPLWSAPFGLLLLDRVPMKSGLTILDVGAGAGFLAVELAQRCGPDARVIARRCRLTVADMGVVRYTRRMELHNRWQGGAA